MQINKITIKNWKCFINKTFVFDKENIINWRNGQGKTSLFQAILFCLFGKRPAGFNFTTLRNDPTVDCIIIVELTYKDKEDLEHNIRVKRQFGRTNTATLVQDNELICSSATAVFNFINKILPYDIISVLWAPGTLQSSNILQPDFLVKSLFNYIFDAPQKIEKYYKYEIYNINKRLKSFNITSNYNEIELKLSDIENKIKTIKSKIKERSSSSDYQINIAKSAEQAKQELNSLNITETIPINICLDFKNLTANKDITKLRNKLQKDLEEENMKTTSVLDGLPLKTIQFIKDESEKGKCIVCDRDWNSSMSKKLEKLISQGKIDHEKIKDINNKLSLLSYNPKIIEDNIKFNQLSNIVSKCPNFEDIINNYNADNNKLWDELDNLEKEQKKLLKQKEECINYIKEKENQENTREKLKVVQNYISDASEYYSNSMTENGSIILNKLSPKFDKIFLDEGEYKIIKVDESLNNMELLSAAQLSGGERTLVGISLILAAHSLFFPDIPLLFDESFSALDREHISALKMYFKENNFQLFIITHDNFWLE